MEKPTLEPMKFGSENDLKKALTELRVIKEQNGKISENEYRTVSIKYMFPIDFLKKGLQGFSYPDDYLISKSKWYPILYSWIVQSRERSLTLFRLYSAYVWRTWLAIYLITFTLMVLFIAETWVFAVYRIEMFQNLTVIILPFVGILIGLILAFEIHLNDKKVKIAEYSQQLNEEGLGYIVGNNKRLVISNYRALAYGLGKLVIRNLESADTFIVIPSGVNEEEREPSANIKWLSRLHLLPKSFAKPKKEKVPVFFGENPYVEYQKRISEATRDKTKER